MTTHQSRLRRLGRDLARAGTVVALAMVVTTAWASAESGGPRPEPEADASPAAVTAGSLRIETPEGAQLDTGSETTPFLFELPVGAACTGDTGFDSYYVNSYIVGSGVDPTTLTFDPSGPVPLQLEPPQATYRSPLYLPTGDPFMERATAPRAGSGQPGPVVNLPVLDFTTLVVDDLLLLTGDYNVGVACWKVPLPDPENPGELLPGVLDRIWNIEMAIESTDTPTTTFAWSVEQAVATTTALAVEPADEVDQGEEVTLTAAVSPDAAEGEVTFWRDGVSLGTAVEVDEGEAVLVTDALAPGTFDLTATFEPSDPALFVASTSAPVEYEVISPDPIDTTTVLTIDPDGQAQLGTEVTLTATVTPDDAAGEVEFLDGTDPIGDPVVVVDGIAELTTDELSLGAHTFAAEFHPDDADAYTGSGSGAVTYTIVEEEPPAEGGVARVVDATGRQINSGTEATAFSFDLPEGAACTGDTENDGYYVFGYMISEEIDPGTLTFDPSGPTPLQVGPPHATYRSPLYEPTGANYTERSTAPRSAPGEPGTIVNIPVLDLRAVVVDDVLLPSGDYNIGIACWKPELPDPEDPEETLPAVLDNFWNAEMTVVADAGPPQSATWTVDQAAATTTTLAITPAAEAAFGDEVTLTATVAPVEAAGAVTFLRNGTAINSDPIAVAAGTAVLTTSDLPGGEAQYVARFAPTDTATYFGSDSEGQTYTITLTETTTALAVTPTEGAGVGDEVTLTATVTPAEAGGTVVFLDGPTAIGEPVVVASGAAALTTTTLEAGEHSLTARFEPTPETEYDTSTSAAVTYTITAEAEETDITLEVDPEDEAELGEDVVLTATVTPADAAGTVIFEDDGDELDGEANLSAALAVEILPDGTATLTVSDLEVGDHTFTATFDPDDPDAFATSTSVSVSLEIIDPSATSSTSSTSSTTSTTLGSTTSTTAPGGSLPRTGSPVGGMVLWAGVAIVLGRIAILLGRRVEQRPAGAA